jgi:hypothetical protein
MGFYTKALGPESQKIVTQLSPKILDACSKAQDELAAGRGLTEAARWFGTTPAATVKTKVGKLRSFFNLNAITLRFAGGPDERGEDTAAALRPSQGWSDYTNVTKAHNTSFEMYLNSDWEQMPLWSTQPLQTAGDGGKFATLVHELSHLCLNTEDHKYTAQKAVLLATNSPNLAIENADNWGFFVEEFVKR